MGWFSTSTKQLKILHIKNFTEKSTTEKYWYFSIYPIKFCCFQLFICIYNPTCHAEGSKVSLWSLKWEEVFYSKYHILQVEIGKIYIYNRQIYKFLNQFSTFYKLNYPQILRLQKP